MSETIKCDVRMLPAKESSITLDLQTNKLLHCTDFMISYFDNDQHHIAQQVYLTSKEIKPKIGDHVIGRCNNIEGMPWKVMLVTDIMPHSKSVYCGGIWTDDSEATIIATTDEDLILKAKDMPRISREWIKEGFIPANGKIDHVDISALCFAPNIGPNDTDKDMLRPELYCGNEVVIKSTYPTPEAQ